MTLVTYWSSSSDPSGHEWGPLRVCYLWSIIFRPFACQRCQISLIRADKSQDVLKQSSSWSLKKKSCVCFYAPLPTHTFFCYGAHTHDTFEELNTSGAYLLMPARVAVGAGDVSMADSSENADLSPTSLWPQRARLIGFAFSLTTGVAATPHPLAWVSLSICPWWSDCGCSALGVLSCSVASVQIKTFPSVIHPQQVPHTFNSPEKPLTMCLVAEPLFE